MASQPLVATHLHHSPSKMTSVKQMAESPNLISIPSNYVYSTNPNEVTGYDPDEPIPIIDYSLLTSSDPDQRSKTIQDLGKACKEWGFFMVINHNVGEGLMKEVIEGFKEFFDMPKEVKEEYNLGEGVLDPIRCGSSFNAKTENVSFWRDFIKCIVHPHFHFPDKPQGFREIAYEYCKRIRELTKELLKGISVSLGLEELYLEKIMELDSGFQLFSSNLYPTCPQPQHAMGLPPHSDYGLLTILYQNGVGGLQLLRNGNWINVHHLPNSFLVNTAEHIEIASNGKYKSVVHRVVVNNKSPRISVVVGNGPSLDAIVCPAKELVNTENDHPAFMPMKFQEYLEMQQSNHVDGKSSLDRIRI